MSAWTQRAGSALLPTNLTFPAAGFVAFCAGRAWTACEGTRELADSLGLKLPWVLELMHESPSAVLIGLLASAALILSASYVSRPPGWSRRADRAATLCAVSVVGAFVFLGGVSLAALPLTLSTIHLASQC